jgi:hypothetical protein
MLCIFDNAILSHTPCRVCRVNVHALQSFSAAVTPKIPKLSRDAVSPTFHLRVAMSVGRRHIMRESGRMPHIAWQRYTLAS